MVLQYLAQIGHAHSFFHTSLENEEEEKERDGGEDDEPKEASAAPR